jgi:hypothetical protein
MTQALGELTEVLRDARELLGRPENDFAWSSWTDGPHAIRELDALIAHLEAGERPQRLTLEVLFAPTGPIQEVSLSSGWAETFHALAGRLDAALAKAYA